MAAPEGRARGGGLLRTLSELFWVIALAVIVIYAFFLVLGALDPGDVVALSIVVGVLLLLYLVRAWWISRQPSDEGRDPRIVSARERRGF